MQMNPPFPPLRLITCLATGVGCSITGVAMAQSDAHNQRPPLYAASATQAPRLLATFVHPQAERSLAVVQQASAASQMLQVGEQIGSGLRLHAIAHDHIVIARGSQLFTLRLLGQAGARKQPARAPNDLKATSTGSDNTAASSNDAAILRADNLDAVRAACSDTATMTALPDAQKAELTALGLCNAP